MKFFTVFAIFFAIFVVFAAAEEAAGTSDALPADAPEVPVATPTDSESPASTEIPVPTSESPPV